MVVVTTVIFGILTAIAIIPAIFMAIKNLYRYIKLKYHANKISNGS